jgi:hypothetical protein
MVARDLCVIVLRWLVLRIHRPSQSYYNHSMSAPVQPYSPLHVPYGPYTPPILHCSIPSELLLHSFPDHPLCIVYPTSISGLSQGPVRGHSGSIQGPFRVCPESIQGSFSLCTGPIQYSNQDSIQGLFRCYSMSIHSQFRVYSGPVQAFIICFTGLSTHQV